MMMWNIMKAFIKYRSIFYPANIGRVGLFVALVWLSIHDVLATAIYVTNFNNGGSLMLPTGVVINPLTSGIFVTDTANNRVVAFDSLGNSLSTYRGAPLHTLNAPTGVTFNPALGQTGRLFVSDSGNSQVQVLDFNSGTNTVGFSSAFGGVTMPTAIAVYPPTNVLVSDTGANGGTGRVSLFDATGTLQTQFGNNGHINQPVVSDGLSVNGTATAIFITDTVNNQILTYAGTGMTALAPPFGSSGTNPGQFNFPSGMSGVTPSVNPVNNHLLVADFGNNRIQTLNFDNTTNTLSFYSLSTGGTNPGQQFNGPMGVALNPNTGQIYVVEQSSNRIALLFDPTEWTLPGTSNFNQPLPLNQALTLNNGFHLNVQSHTTLTTNAFLTINAGGSFVTNSLIMDGGSLSDNANSTLSAPITLTANNARFLSGVNNTLQLTGNITGAGGLVIEGPGLIKLLGTNNFTAPTTVNSGTLEVNSNSLPGNINVMSPGVLIFDQANTGVYAGNVAGNGTLIKKNAGNLTLTGNAIANSVAVNEGSLVVNGSLTGSTTVNAGTLAVNGFLIGPVTLNDGTLRGTGIINGNVINNNGNVSPGNNAIGTLTVLGDYNPGPNGITSIQIDAQHSSVLSVFNTANLNGALALSGVPGENYVVGQSYEFLQAANVVGNFSSFPTTLGFYRFNVVYTPTSASLVIIGEGLDLTETNNNQTAVYTYLGSLSLPQAGSDLGQIENILTSLSPGNLADALESISPGRTTAGSFVVQENVAMLHTLSASRLARLRDTSSFGYTGMQFNGSAQNRRKELKDICDRLNKRNKDVEIKHYNVTQSGLSARSNQDMWHAVPFANDRGGVWAQGFGQYLDQEQRRDDPGFDSRTGGILAGMDYTPWKNYYFGIGVGHYETKLNLDSDGGRNRINNNFVTLYGTWFCDSVYIDASLIGGLSEYRVEQHTAFASVNRVSKGKHRGSEISPHIGIGYVWNCCGTMLSPFIDGDYAYVHERGYNLLGLNGADSLSFALNKRNSSLYRGEIGLKVYKTYEFTKGSWTPEAKLSYVNKKRRRGNLTSALIGQPGAFIVQNFAGTRNQISPAAGVVINFKDGAFLSARVDSEFGSKYKAYEISLMAGISF